MKQVTMRLSGFILFSDKDRKMLRAQYEFSLLHRACFRVTQSPHQPLHIYKIYKILHIKNSLTCFGRKTILREL